MARDKVTGNIFYHGNDCIFLFFYDIDDEETRVNKLLTARGSICPQYSINFFASRHHAMGHAVIDCGRDYTTWVGLAFLTNIHEYWENQAIKFLRLTPDLAQFYVDRKYIPAINKMIDRDEKYKPADYEVWKPPNAIIARQIYNAYWIASKRGQSEKITNTIFLMLLSDSQIPTEKMRVEDDSLYEGLEDE